MLNSPIIFSMTFFLAIISYLVMILCLQFIYMLDQIKKKRLSLTHQLQSARPRISSVQKRKLIQANLQQFQKNLQQSRNTSPLNSNKNLKSSRQLNQTPTMRDLISPLQKIRNQQIKKQQQIESPRFKAAQNKQVEPSQKLNNEQFRPNQINKQQRQKNEYNLFQTAKFEPVQNTKQNNEHENPKQQKNVPKSQNKYDQIQQSSIQQEKPQNVLKKLSFGNQQQLRLQMGTPKSKVSQNKSINLVQLTYKVRQDQLNLNYNQSKYGGSSSNNSSAIFFTSQFRQFINRDNPEPPLQPAPPSQPIPEHMQTIEPATNQQSYKKQHSEHSNNVVDKSIDQSFLKIGDQQESSSVNESRTKKLSHIQSGRSLAFSNNDQSLLRYSKGNQSAVHEMITKKLDQELVLQIQQFGKNKFNQFVDHYQEIYYKNLVQSIKNQLKIIKKLKDFISIQNKNLLRYYFDGFLILKEYKFQNVKNQIKADNYLKQLNSNLLKNCFIEWKRIPLQNQKKSIYKLKQKQQKLMKNIFQVFRIIWFDSKVKNQVDLYYLSKIFSAFRNICTKQHKKYDNIALKQYCRSLKKIYFNKIQQGTQVMRKQRLNQQLAENHYQFVMLKKFFDAWLQQCDRSPQYISLTMTSKNVFKQTQDNKWFGIKTMDFKQTKQ